MKRLRDLSHLGLLGICVAAATGCGAAAQSDARLAAHPSPPLGTSAQDPSVAATDDRWSTHSFAIEQRPFPWHRIVAYHGEDAFLHRVLDIPQGGFLLGLKCAPDRRALALSYIPPQPEDGGDYDRAGIYLADLDEGLEASALRTLLWPEPGERLILPVWDSEGLYYTRVGDAPLGEIIVQLERFDFESGEVEVIAEGASEAALSATGDRLTFVWVNRYSAERSLVVSAPDGSDTRRLLGASTLSGIARPAFGPRGNWIYFLADTPEESLAPKHTGHDAPLRFYRVPVDGGVPELVFAWDQGLYDASLDADAGGIALTTAEGLWHGRFAGDSREDLEDSLTHLHVSSRSLRGLDTLSIPRSAP